MTTQLVEDCQTQAVKYICELAPKNAVGAGKVIKNRMYLHLNI